MPKQLLVVGMSSPGGLGLNKQTSAGILPPEWATVVSNAVFDDKGRLSARKGTQRLHASPSASAFKTIHEYIDATGSKLIIGSADNKIYKLVSGTLTDISGTITTPTADNWKFQNFNGKCVGYQEGHAPIELATVGGSFTNGGGTQYNGTDALAAYGRIWTIHNNVLYYSDLLINSYAGGSSGFFDLASYWKGGMDEAIAIADFNGFMVVFGKRNILIYDNPDDPTSAMSLVENISGIGCMARDTVQNTGEDIVFLSADGIRTLGRVIQEKSLPTGDLSINNREYILEYVLEENTSEIKSAYHRREGFYIISLPTSGKTFYMDMRKRLQDASARTTEWDIAPVAMMSTVSGLLYMAQDTGYISEYKNYLDSVASDGTNGNSYLLDYEGSWSDLEDEVANLLKIPKSIHYTILGGNSQTVTTKWAFDYEDSFHTHNITIPSSGASEWGEGEWGEGEWSGGAILNALGISAAGTGQVIKVGFSVEVNGSIIAIQRVNMKLKLGRND